MQKVEAKKKKKKGFAVSSYGRVRLDTKTKTGQEIGIKKKQTMFKKIYRTDLRGDKFLSYENVHTKIVFFERKSKVTYEHHKQTCFFFFFG